MINLIPAQIPWNLHSYLADFRVNAREGKNLDIIVNTCFLANNSISTIFTQEEININREKGKLYTEKGYEKLSYQVLKISFEIFSCFNMSHESKDFGILNSENYKIFSPTLDKLSKKNPIEYREEAKKIINQTGFNPDPLIYLVDDNQSLTRVQKRLNMKKYLFCNKESNIEVIGSEFTWESLGALYWE